MTIIYHVHPVTRELVGVGEADPDPMDIGIWLVPAHAFTDAPPEPQEKKAIIRGEDGWTLVPDYRGSVFSTATGEESKLEKLGELPAGFTDLPYPGSDYCWKKGKWVVDEAAKLKRLEQNERAWRNAEVESVKWLRERHRDEQDMRRETTLSAEQFDELLAYLQDLRDWPQSESFPDTSRRPAAPSWIAR